jgi:hypothetical protein
MIDIGGHDTTDLNFYRIQDDSDGMSHIYPLMMAVCKGYQDITDLIL